MSSNSNNSMHSGHSGDSSPDKFKHDVIMMSHVWKERVSEMKNLTTILTISRIGDNGKLLLKIKRNGRSTALFPVWADHVKSWLHYLQHFYTRGLKVEMYRADNKKIRCGGGEEGPWPLFRHHRTFCLGKVEEKIVKMHMISIKVFEICADRLTSA